MNRKTHLFFFMTLVLILQACNLPASAEPVEATPPSADTPTAQHQTIPVLAPMSKPYPDVTSVDTAPEKRAPYGDSYDINRLERPFTQDMVYIPDIDIASFSLSEDGEFYFVSIGLVGKNPNNLPDVQYAVELDTNLDSFGDFLIVATPPFSEEWTAENIKIFTDTNRDTAGNSASRSDAPFSGNGYDTLIHDIVENVGDDIDLAWVRINADPQSTIQFAFKKSFAGNSFLYAVMADVGLKDIARLDYVDHFTEKDAGSSVRSNPNYPLKALYAVDNTCYQAFGFEPSGYEPKICPEIVQPFINNPSQPTPGVDYCTSIGSPNPGNCPWGWSDAPFCVCTPG